jgi:hypothetical protein
MEQKLWIIFIVIASFGSFLYFRHTDKDHHKMDNILFVLGGASILLGSLGVLLLHDFQFLVNCLVLKDATVMRNGS